MNELIHRICIVDDSDIIRHTFRAILKNTGYGVTEFASGREFLDGGLEEPADCILLDLEMPGPNGIEILDAMQDSARATPVIVVTGTDNAVLLAAADRDIVAAVLKNPSVPMRFLLPWQEPCASPRTAAEDQRYVVSLKGLPLSNRPSWRQRCESENNTCVFQGRHVRPSSGNRTTGRNGKCITRRKFAEAVLVITGCLVSSPWR